MTSMIENVPNLIAFWDFQDDEYAAKGPSASRLTPRNGAIERASEGVFGPTSLRFRPTGNMASAYLVATAAEAPELNIGGTAAQVTVLAWIKREPSDYKGCEFVAGVWNEHGRRQYGMFLNLGIHDSRQQLGAHISSHGGPTPGFPYCMDAAIGATKIATGDWHSVAITYDGVEARAYLDGALDIREPQGEPGRNPFTYPGGLLKGASDFTVGAVSRPNAVVEHPGGGFQETGDVVANPFVGLLGGLAVFDRALTAPEIGKLASFTVRSA
jgi:hypothetical protein